MKTKDYNIGDLVALNKDVICEYLGHDFSVGISGGHLYRPISENHAFNTLERDRISNGKSIGGCIPFGEKMDAYKVYKCMENKAEEELAPTDDYSIGELISIDECVLLYLGKIERYHVYYPTTKGYLPSSIDHYISEKGFREGSMAVPFKLIGLKKKAELVVI